MPVVGELFAGVELSASRDKNRPRLVRGLNALFLWPIDRAAAEEYGRLGHPMQQIDIQIAAIDGASGTAFPISLFD